LLAILIRVGVVSVNPSVTGGVKLATDSRMNWPDPPRLTDFPGTARTITPARYEKPAIAKSWAALELGKGDRGGKNASDPVTKNHAAPLRQPVLRKKFATSLAIAVKRSSTS